MVIEKILAFGHANILGTHKTTIEITKEPELSKQGDCIIGVNADKSCADLSNELKTALKSNKKFEIILRAGGIEEKISGFGSPDLKLTNKKDIVLRKSSHIDDRTLLIRCDKACTDLNKKLIQKLQNPHTELELLIETISVV